MKTRLLSLITLRIAPLSVLAAVMLSHSARAQTNGTWSNVAGGSWPTAANWTGSTVATGVDATADFSTLNITANATVTLDGARTVGTLRFGDTTASNDWILNTGSGGPLTLDVSAGTASIAVTTGRTATIGAVLAGNDGVTVSSAATGTTGGNLILGAANTFTGGLFVTGGIVQLNNAAAGGSGSITIGGSPNTGVVNKLTVNGGVTITNPITVNSGTAPAAGNGAVQQVGTGQATVNGAITLNAGTANGGHFVGGGAVGNELVLGGPIATDPSVTIGHRAGRVIYRGGGTGYTGMVVTDVALVGANNGISTAASVQLGGSGNATLDLNGFDQSLAGLQLGNAGAGLNYAGTVLLGAKTLSLTGGVSTISSATANASHTITATTGALDTGAGGTTFTVSDSTAVDDLVITANINGAGGLTKAGPGMLSLNGAAVAGPVNVTGGILAAGRATAFGSFSSPSLNFDAGTAVQVKLSGTSSDVISTGTLTTTGTASVIAFQAGGSIPAGTYPLISYTGASPGVGGFSLFPSGHLAGSLIDTGTAIALQVTGNDRLIWDGTSSTAWSTAATGNWKLQSSAAPADFVSGDEVIFADNPLSSIVDIAAPVVPSRVNFANSTATAYTVTGTSGIYGPSDLVKTGNGTATLRTQNGYLGATSVNQGTLELDHDATGNAVLTGSSGVNVAAGATLALTRDDGGFTFNRSISGTGNVNLNAHSAGGTGAQAIVLNGNNTGFTGTMRLLAPVSGTYRITQVPAVSAGAGAIEVQSGAQFYTAASQTYTNNISISGTGYQDTNGLIGALRLETASNWAGNILVNGTARIGAHNATGANAGIVSGSISGGDLEVNATNYNNSYTVVFTGSNSYGTTTIGGQNTQTGGPPSMRLNIGANGTTGTLGSGNVTINGDGANGVLGFDRSNGYTLLPGQTITGGGTNLLRTFIDLDCQGAGFDDNGNTITLGGSSNLTGGQVRAGQSRANTVSNFSGNLTCGRLGNAVVNNSTININSGAVLNVGYFTTGEAANNGGTVNQAAGTTVNVTEQLRLGHFGTETSTYNMNGGTLTLTGASPINTPSTAGAGNTTTTGDNNINITNPTTIVGGGIYLGIDGTGIFNQNAGTLTTNWIVLDNRGDTGAGANMPNGIDRYSLNGGTLNLRSSYGLIGRNVTTAVSFAGGTVRVDNTGTGTGTGPNITVPLDAVITMSGTGTTLDTNGAGNGFTLTKNVLGASPLNLTGGGTVNLNAAGLQLVTAPVTTSGTGATLTKLGASTATLTGSGAGFTGGIVLSGGRLDLPAGMTPSGLNIAAGTVLSGEPAISGTTSFNGASLLFDPNSASVLTTGVLDVNGANVLDMTSIPLAAGPWTAINYTSKTGTGTFAVASPGSYRTAPVVTDTGSSITLNVLQGKTLAWSGAVNGVWDINATGNWLDASPPNGAETFFNADIAAFQDGAANPSVTLAGALIPVAVVVNSNATNYTFTSTAGNQLSGPGGITKDGSSTLTLVGANIHSGPTAINGGAVSIAAGTSLGNGSLTNDVNLANGGRLIVTAATDLGATRNIDTGTGGGGITVSNAAATTVTIPGSLTGAGLLTIGSGAAGASTVVLSGDNSGSTGGITVNSDGPGVTTVRLGAPGASPSGGTFTLFNPTSGASGSATGLDLAGNTLPAAVTLVTNSLQSGANSYRTQVVSNLGGGVINGPVQVNGTSIVQFSANNTNAITINGNVTAGTGGFTGPNAVFFLRGSGSGTVNGTINLPGATVSKTDASIWTINSSAGNDWATTGVLSSGAVRIGAHNALPVTSTLNIGQTSDANNSLFDLNGFNQEVAAITYTPGNGNSTRGISNTSATPATLTVNNATDITYGASTGTTGGTLMGNLSLIKTGAGNLTLAGAGSFTGGVLVSSGILTAGGNQNTTALGSPATAGRTLTVNAGAELRMSTNNVFGNGVGNANLPALVSTGGSITSTRYNTIGALTLNGGTLTQSATDSGAYEGYQFKGMVTVGGATASTISSGNGKANHLDANTVFNVADAAAGSAPDLVVTNVLRNQSGDFGQAAGGLTKTGAGTLQLAAGATHTYTGDTIVSGGTLQVDGIISASAVAVNGTGTLGGGGTITLATTAASGGTVAPGASVGTLNFGNTLTFNSGSSYAVEITGAATNDKVNVTGALTANGTIKVTLSGYTPVLGDTFDIADAASFAGNPSFDFSAAALTPGLEWDPSQFSTNGTLRVATASSDPFDAWAASFGLTGGKGGDDDGDGATNLLEFATNSDPKNSGAGARAYGKLHALGGDSVLTLTIAVRKNAAFAASGTKQVATRDKVIYLVEGSDDLLSWNSVVVTELNAADSAAVQATLGLPALGADWEWHSFRTDGGTLLDPREMVRLSVAAQP